MGMALANYNHWPQTVFSMPAWMCMIRLEKRILVCLLCFLESSLQTPRQKTLSVGDRPVVSCADLRSGALALLGATTLADLFQVIYSSRPFGFDNAMLNGILIDARTRNEKEDVTGALLCRQDIYLQMLEGPVSVVQETLKRIQRDDRHIEIKTRLSESITERMFATWAMLHEAQPAIWSPDDIHGGALDRAQPTDFKAVFEAVSKKARREALRAV